MITWVISYVVAVALIAAVIIGVTIRTEHQPHETPDRDLLI
jgi:hypothetical protein